MKKAFSYTQEIIFATHHAPGMERQTLVMQDPSTEATQAGEERGRHKTYLHGSFIHD